MMELINQLTVPSKRELFKNTMIIYMIMNGKLMVQELYPQMQG